MFLVSGGLEVFRLFLDWTISLGVSSLRAVPAFNIVSRTLSPAGLLIVLFVVSELTRGVLGFLFLSAVVDVVSLLFAILANQILLFGFGEEEGSSRVVSRVIDLTVG